MFWTKPWWRRVLVFLWAKHTGKCSSPAEEAQGRQQERRLVNDSKCREFICPRRLREGEFFFQEAAVSHGKQADETQGNSKGRILWSWPITEQLRKDPWFSTNHRVKRGNLLPHWITCWLIFPIQMDCFYFHKLWMKVCVICWFFVCLCKSLLLWVPGCFLKKSNMLK